MLSAASSVEQARCRLCWIDSAAVTCDTGRREALVLAVFVKEPAHDLAASTDLGARNVLEGAHDVLHHLQGRRNHLTTTTTTTSSPHC